MSKKYPIYIISGFLLFCSCFNSEKKFSSQTPAADTITVKKEIYNSKTALKLDSLFNKWRLQNKFNGNVLIARHGKIIYKKCFGYANYEKKQPLCYRSEFQLASVSKQFTAAGIMMLEEKGLLKYSDTIQKFLPEFPFKNITIDMLLSHRSGLANYMYFCEEYCANYETPVPNQQVIDWVIAHKPKPYRKPGKRFQYNNTNYCLLAAIIEKVSGTTFENFLSSQIFMPLGMNNTWVKKQFPETERPNLTQGYEYSWKKAEINYLDGVVGDKNIYSSIEDLFKWDQALYNGKLLKHSSLENAFTPKSNELKGIKNYGYGWRLLNYPDGTKMVYHNGWWHGYNNSFYRRLNDQTTVIILSNRINKEIFQTSSIFEILDGFCHNMEAQTDV